MAQKEIFPSPGVMGDCIGRKVTIEDATFPSGKRWISGAAVICAKSKASGDLSYRVRAESYRGDPDAKDVVEKIRIVGDGRSDEELKREKEVHGAVTERKTLIGSVMSFTEEGIALGCLAKAAGCEGCFFNGAGPDAYIAPQPAVGESSQMPAIELEMIRS